MSEDFSGKLQDVEDEEEESGDEKEEEEPEKEMGETEAGADKLDEQVWGSDEEEEEEEEEEGDVSQEVEEETGQGAGKSEPELAAKDNETSAADEEEDSEDREPLKKQQKEVNEMEDPDPNDDQVDPYHGNQQPEPEPEPLDLPDDLQLDEGDVKEDGEQEENPFDIDKMKEPPTIDEEQEGQEETEEKNEVEEEEKSDGSEDEIEDGATEKDTDEVEPMDVDKPDSGKVEEGGAKDEDKEGDKPKDEEMPDDAEKATPSEDEPSQAAAQSASDDTKEGSKDKTEIQQKAEGKEQEKIGKNEDNDAKETQGVGMAESDRSQGHEGETSSITSRPQRSLEEREKRQRKPGESDSQRSLGQTNEPVKKKLKTMSMAEEEKGDDDDDDEDEEGVESGEKTESDLYEHIREAKDHYDTQTLDAATKEQAEKQPVPNLDDEQEEELKDDDDVVMQEDEPHVSEEHDTPKQRAEKTTDKSKKEQERREKGETGDVEMESKTEVEGEKVDTMRVERGSESTFHTQYHILEDSKHPVDLQKLRLQLEDQLGAWNQPPASAEAEQTWQMFTSVTSGLARELSEQLRLVLEPTQASRLQGDYRTGRRINMRKVIPYIASQFRKDKIWLRRTKPSKRQYQIVLAIDDSSSMADNHSKELAFESLALVSGALTLLEAGELGVISFGEVTQVLHQLGEPFTEQSGARLLQQFSFNQKKTLVGELVNFVTVMLSELRVRVTSDRAQLLVIVSDGRGVFSEGSEVVRRAVRAAQDAGIFMVFLIVDNPQSKDSILDIRMPNFREGKLISISSYLDNFPFPFYMILRDINALPAVLSDALRQWFELVTNTDRQ